MNEETSDRAGKSAIPGLTEEQAKAIISAHFAELGRRSHEAKLKKSGNQHYKEMAKKRWSERGS
jgi:hypothetical protein